MQRSLLLVLAILLTFNAFAQQQLRCSTEKYQEEVFQKMPWLKENQAKSDQILYNLALSGNYQQRNSSVILTIPVVVHIMHLNGPENISDSLVIASIDELNLRFQNGASYFDSTGIDTQIQFCLASVDPYGSPTTGITRTVSNTTNQGSTPDATDWNMKNLTRWAPHLYLNIWVINSVPAGSNVAGYATMPSSAGNSIDGIVVLHPYLNNSYVLTHEVGHYLGLHHTFYEGCKNDNCLLDGDQICDTPPDQSSDYICPSNSCSTDVNDTTGLSPFFTDVNELPNYMDYTNCSLSFSEGQSERMTNSLTVLRPQLLLSNGCGAHPGGAIPIPSFTSANGCPSILFTNTSLNGVGASWDFNGDGLIDAAGNYVTYNFPSTGNYLVTMYANGYGGIDSITQSVYVQVRPYQNYPLKTTSGIVLSLIEQSFAFCAGSTVTLYGEPGMVSYNWSTGDTTQNISFIPSSTFNITLTCVDSSGISWTTCTPAHAVEVPVTIPPVLTVLNHGPDFCMTDMGSTLTIHANFSPLMLFNVWFGPSSTIPNFSDSMLTFTITGIYNTFFVNQTDSNGCMSTSNILNLNLHYVPFGLSTTQSGDTLFCLSPNVTTQWYFNGAPIPGAIGQSIVMTATGCYAAYGWYSNPGCGILTDSICHISTDIIDLTSENISIGPNPVTEIIQIHGITKTTNYTILNAIGKEILYGSVEESGTIFVKELSSGMYFLRVGNWVFKFVKEP